MKVRYAGLLSGASLLVIAQVFGSYAAKAQDAGGVQPSNQQQNAKPSGDIEEVVVTGTLLRGQQPVGSLLTSIDADTIKQLGAVDTSQLLGALPEDTNFNSRPQVGNYGQYQTVNAPILRYLGGGSSGSNSTLLLVDGVRMPGMGIQQTSSDIDAIAPGAIARVEIVPDGGSATYGADAVGGVVNLITRKDFDGVEVGGHFGGADNYTQWDASVTAGKTWDGGSAWISYDYADHGMLYGRDRDYVHDLNYTTTPYTGNEQTCNPGNYFSGGTNFPISGGVPTVGPANTCDTSQNSTFFPSESRHSVAIGVDQDLTSWLTFDLLGYYMHRNSDNNLGPNYYTVPATYGASTGTVNAVFEPNLDLRGSSKLDTWGVIPKFTAKLPFDWELTAFANFGEGSAAFQGLHLGGDATALGTDVTTGAFNPFTGMFAATPAGQAALAYQANYDNYSTGVDKIANTREVLNGPLFSLPGGEVKAAVGFEYLHEQFDQQNGTAEADAFNTVPTHVVSRQVTSLFGELSVPIVGENNNFPGIHQLSFDVSDRYDSYSDFGSTNNPKFALTYKPVSWWAFRGNWSTSFQAPSLASTSGAIPAASVAYPASLFGGNPAFPGTAGKYVVLLYPGGGVDLQPQKAKTWEAGTDITLPFFPELSTSATYYNIDFTNRIGNPAFYSASFYSLYPSSYIMNTPAHPLTSAQIAAYIAPTYNHAQLQQYVNNPSEVYALQNGLTQNLSTVDTSGIDFNINYDHATSFGTIFAGAAGTYILSYATQATPTSTFQGLDANSVTRWRTAVTVGATVGDFLGKLTWNRSGDYDIKPTAGDAFQSKVDSFSVFNLAFQYAPQWTGMWQDTSLTLNIDNVFDTNPPSYNGSNGAAFGYAGFTLGRFIQIGIDKKF